MERALAYCDWAVARGSAIRSHVDRPDPRPWPPKRCCTCARRSNRTLDLQLVAFPQDAWLRGALDNLKRALGMGVDVVAAFRNLTHHAGRRRIRAHPVAPPSAACAWTCTATKAVTCCRAPTENVLGHHTAAWGR